MKNTKSVKCSFIAKFFSGVLFVISFFITILSFVCIIFLTSSGSFDSSKKAAITSMRDTLYHEAIQNYCNDALDLCVFGEKDVSIFDDTNFRFQVLDENNKTIMSNMSDGKTYIYKFRKYFTYYEEDKSYDATDRLVVVDLLPQEYVIECFVDSNLYKDDQFSLLNFVVNIIYNLRFISILICLVGAFATVATFIFLISSAGYHENGENPRLIWFDKIFFECLLIAFALVIVGEFIVLDCISIYSFSISTAIIAVFMVLFDTTLLLLLCTSLTARLRCRSFWKTTLVFTILHGIFLAIKKIGLFIAKVASYIPVLWQLILGVVLFCLLEFILLVTWGIEDTIILFILEKLILIPALFYIAYMLYKLEQTGKEISQGNLGATIDTKYFLGTFKKQGKNLNNIKLGIASAVEDKMKSERFKTELITNVSHDIKTPLTSIINYVDLLDKEDLQNERAKEYIQVISKNSDRLKKLVVDLVDASKASSGVLKVDMQPLKIDVLLEQLAGEYSERLMSHNLDLIMRKPEESIQIMADGQRIYRVFDNLMNNICKYALPNTRVYLLLEKQDDKAVISFKNISATELDMSASDLMERFVRGDKSRNTEGSGLGLSIAESLTRLQNGEFNIQLDGDLFKIIISFPII